jgi:hypothetical protein
MRVQTDTASVLHETIEYIKFLHDQVGVSVCVCVCEYYHDSPPLIIAHLKPEAPALARVFYTRIIRRGLIDRLVALTWCCLRLVSLQVLSAPYLKNNGHHQVPHLKVGASTSVTVQVCMLHARLLSFSL